MKRFQGILYAIISSAAFGMIPLFAVPALRSGMNTSSVLFYRMFFSVLLMGVLLLVKGVNMRVSLRQLVTIMGLSVFYTASSLFLLESYLYIPSGVATTIHFLYPVFVTVLMVGFFKEKLSRMMVTAVMMAVAGVWILSLGNGEGTISLPGLGMVLITVAAYGSYIVGVNKSCVNQVNGLAMTFYVLLFTAIQCGINVWIREGGVEAIPNMHTGVNLILLGLIPTLVSNLFLVLAIHKVGSTVTAVLGCMEPFTAVGMGVLFLGEKITGIQYMGVLVILIAVAIVILARNKPRVLSGTFYRSRPGNS